MNPIIELFDLLKILEGEIHCSSYGDFWNVKALFLRLSILVSPNLHFSEPVYDMVDSAKPARVV